jgi:hypothetical protein
MVLQAVVCTAAAAGEDDAGVGARGKTRDPVGRGCHNVGTREPEPETGGHESGGEKKPLHIRHC